MMMMMIIMMMASGCFRVNFEPKIIAESMCDYSVAHIIIDNELCIERTVCRLYYYMESTT